MGRQLQGWCSYPLLLTLLLPRLCTKFILIQNFFMKKLLLLLILSFFSAQGFTASCPEGTKENKNGKCVPAHEPVKGEQLLIQPDGQMMPPIDGSAPLGGHAPGTSPQDPPIEGKKYLAEGWEDHGIILKAKDVGLNSQGVGWGDPTAILLPDGRIRLYVLAERLGIRSLISSDGLQFELEKGTRIRQPVSHPEIAKNPAGGYRLFYGSDDQSKSAISNDGLNFTVESGSRFSASVIDSPTLSPISYYDTKQGYFRGYVSDLPGPGTGPGVHGVYSLHSEDLVHWLLKGLVIGGRGEKGVMPEPINRESEASLSMSAEAPSVYDHGDGTADIYFCFNMLSPHLGGPTGVFKTTVDGESYSKPELIVSGCDPNVIQLRNGTFVMYYGDYDPKEGGYVLAITR